MNIASFSKYVGLNSSYTNTTTIDFCPTNATAVSDTYNIVSNIYNTALNIYNTASKELVTTLLSYTYREPLGTYRVTWDSNGEGKLSKAYQAQDSINYFTSSRFLIPVFGLLMASSLTAYGACKFGVKTAQGIGGCFVNAGKWITGTKHMTIRLRPGDLSEAPTTPCKEFRKSFCTTITNALLTTTCAAITIFITGSFQDHFTQLSSYKSGTSCHYYAYYPKTFGVFGLDPNNNNSDCTMEFFVNNPLLVVGLATTIFTVICISIERGLYSLCSSEQEAARPPYKDNTRFNYDHDNGIWNTTG